MPYDSTTYSSKAATGTQGRTTVADAIFAALSARADAQGRVAASHSTLMIWADCCRQSAQNAVSKLRKSGRLIVVRRGNSAQRPTIYELRGRVDWSIDWSTSNTPEKPAENTKVDWSIDRSTHNPTENAEENILAVHRKVDQSIDRSTHNPTENIEENRKVDQSIDQSTALARVDNPPARVRVESDSSLRSESYICLSSLREESREALSSSSSPSPDPMDLKSLADEVRWRASGEGRLQQSSHWFVLEPIIAKLRDDGISDQTIIAAADAIGARQTTSQPRWFAEKARSLHESLQSALTAQPNRGHHDENRNRKSSDRVYVTTPDGAKLDAGDGFLAAALRLCGEA